MVTTHSLGYPRIGKQRELKFALEAYWQGKQDVSALTATAEKLRSENWLSQSKLDWVPVGDFSYYDHVLDTSLLFGNLPKRVDQQLAPLDQYFQAARGRSSQTLTQQPTSAAEMTKWLDTNYHYLVPEFDHSTTFSLQPELYEQQIRQALDSGIQAKPVLLGPVSYLLLGKSKDDTQPLTLLADLLPCYERLLQRLADMGVSWVQIDEPVLALDLQPDLQRAFEQSYFALNKSPLNLLLTSYFGPLRENLQLACNLPTAGLHIDAVYAAEEVQKVIDWLPAHKILSLGVINGRNIWKTDLNQLLDQLEPIHQHLADRLWLAPSCSLLHVPVDLSLETGIPAEIRNWLAFAEQKLDELAILAQALNQGRDSVRQQLIENQAAVDSRHHSTLVHQPAVRERVANITEQLFQRQSPYQSRAIKQAQQFKLPLLPTTTIGSFPQTADIRNARLRYRKGELSTADYHNIMKDEIKQTIAEQEKLGLDVLVHGEAERNDMVEYFGQQLQGYTFSQFGWVQSYGSRCVKPPIIYGDIARANAMTVDWISYAQTLSDKPVKGMLTGPVTMLNWSFVRDDQPRSQTCQQLALAIRDEVLDLEQAGVKIIQIDEAALREGLPLRQQDWAEYLNWATASFRLCANGVDDSTQIHTHMCYSEFNDIIAAIAEMDADVITIETSRSDMELLDVFQTFDYPNEIGPGVYDIHSPNIPDSEYMVQLIKKAAQRIPLERLWINPDCGLKTRQWAEVRPALQAMVAAAQSLRQQLAA